MSDKGSILAAAIKGSQSTAQSQRPQRETLRLAQPPVTASAPVSRPQPSGPTHPAREKRPLSHSSAYAAKQARQSADPHRPNLPRRPTPFSDDEARRRLEKAWEWMESFPTQLTTKAAAWFDANIGTQPMIPHHSRRAYEVHCKTHGLVR